MQKFNNDDEGGAGKRSPASGGSSGTQLVVGIVAMLLGSVFLLGGLVLWVGEKADRLVIFPWAGRLTMLVGIAGLAIGAALAGRRAAMTLSVLMVVGGIALYAIGLAFVEQLGTRLYQAGGLLTALVGLIALYSSYGMDRASQPSGPSRAESVERE
jgi:cation transport ATPase